MPDWAAILDFERAAKHCTTDMYGAWYRDPWAWPEIDFIAMEEPGLVLKPAGQGELKLRLKHQQLPLYYAAPNPARAAAWAE